MLKYKSQIKVRATEPDIFLKNFYESLGTDLQYIFSKVYVGSGKIELENGSLSFLMIWNFYEIIKSGVISINRKNKIITVTFCLDFSGYIIFWCLVSVLFFIIIIFNGFNDPAVLALPFLWACVAFLFTTISQIKFRSKIIEIIKASQGAVISY